MKKKRKMQKFNLRVTKKFKKFSKSGEHAFWKESERERREEESNIAAQIATARVIFRSSPNGNRGGNFQYPPDEIYAIQRRTILRVSPREKKSPYKLPFLHPLIHSQVFPLFFEVREKNKRKKETAASE